MIKYFSVDNESDPDRVPVQAISLWQAKTFFFTIHLLFQFLIQIIDFQQAGNSFLVRSLWLDRFIHGYPNNYLDGKQNQFKYKLMEKLALIRTVFQQHSSLISLLCYS
jgi:hypothetical protein